MNVKRMAIFATMVTMITAIVAMPAALAASDATLRIYGEDGLSAAFPYTDPEAPFDPQSDEAPEKDFIVFNPAYIPFPGIVVSDVDSKEKVFVRQWFVPELVEPVGDVWLGNPNNYTSEDVVTEYTYMFIDKHDNPTNGTALSPSGSYWTKFWMPVADNDDNQTGIDGCDINGDDADDWIVLRDVGDYPGLSGTVDGRKDINISSETFDLTAGEELTFLDHKVVVKNVAKTVELVVDIYYIGNDDPECIGQNIVVPKEAGSYVRAGRHTVNEGAPMFAEPWYLYTESTINGTAYVQVGRLLHTSETFFVDGAEYDVAMIYGPTDMSLKYITIRNPVPEHNDVDLEDLSVIKECVQDGELIPLLPPFNRVHEMVDDINIPDNKSSICTAYFPDNIGSVDDGATFGEDDHLMNKYDTVQDRIIKNVPALDIYFTHKDIDPRFNTSLLEILNESDVEGWNWLDIHTMPDFYKEFVYPELRDIDGGTGDFLLVSSWRAPNSCDARVMFAYDQETGEQDIYVNDYTDYNALRLYGENESFDAAFPYIDPEAPFDPLSVEAPGKDFVTFNPAVMHGIVVNNTDSKMKVFARQWFIPYYKEPVGDVWLGNPNIYDSEDVITEYTYMLIDKHYMPTNGTALSPTGSYWTKFWMPVADNDDNQTGIDGYDINGDGADDWIVLRDVGDYPGLSGIVDGRKDINVSSETFGLIAGEELTFLDHKVVVKNVAKTVELVVDIYYIGNDAPECIGQNIVVPENPGSYVRAGRHTVDEGAPIFAEPWYIYIEDTIGGIAYVQVGRLLHTSETFFVDGAEYDVAMIYGPTNASLKYITIRNPVPEHNDVNLEDLSVIKECVQDGEFIPLLPPFNRVHEMVDDINIPDNKSSICTAYFPDNIGSVDDGAEFGGEDHLMNEYDTVEERIISDIPALDIYFTHKAPEPRFDTNLLEILNESGVESWNWLDIHTMPDFYKEFVYPELPDIDGGEGDWLVTSSFTANNSCGKRVMFAYDAANGTGLYMNSGGVGGGVTACDYYDAPANDGNGDHVVDKPEATNALWDYLLNTGPFGDGTFVKQDALDILWAYLLGGWCS